MDVRDGMVRGPGRGAASYRRGLDVLQVMPIEAGIPFLMNSPDPNKDTRKMRIYCSRVTVMLAFLLALILVTHSDEVARQFPRVDHLNEFNRSALGYVPKGENN